MATASPPATAHHGSELDLRYYTDLLWRSRLVLAAAAAIGLGLGLLVAFLQTPEYRATAMLQIEPPTPTFLSVTDALVGGGSYWQNADFYNTQFKVLHSAALGDKVVDRLKLRDRPPFKDNPSPGSTFMARVAIEPIPESRLVNVYVTHPNPQEAALWANGLVEGYIEQSLSSRVEAAQKAYDWLQERLAATQKSMREAQDKLFKGYESQDLYVPEGSVSAVTASITKLNEDLIGVQGRRIALEAALRQISQMRSRGQSLETVPQVAVDTLNQSLGTQFANLRLELSRAKEKYKEAHPEVQKLQAQIDQVQKARDERAAQIVTGMQAELSQLQRQEAEIRQAVEAQQSQATTQGRKGAEVELMRKEAESSKNLYEVLLQKLHETDIAASIRNNNITIVERAVAPGRPIRPVKRKIAAIGLVVGLLLGVGLVLGRDYLGNTIKDAEEVERYLHLDLLAAVPRYEEASAHLVTEAYQNLRTALIFARREERGQVVLVTSTAPQEGKTTTLVNLANLLAASGERTVAIDFDLRRSQLHSRLQLPREPGVTDYFVTHQPVDALLHATRSPNLSIITAGPLPPNPPAIITRREVATFLDELRARFDWVLVDSPPLASVTDALLLARHADMSVFVALHNGVDKKLIKRSVTALRKATSNLLGAVLNGVDVKAKGYSYYYYSEDKDTDRKGRSRAPAPAKPAQRA